MARNPHYKDMHSGREYLEAKRICLEFYQYVCHICEHDGAGDADYIIPISVNPDQDKGDPWNKKPAHGALSRCPTCGKCCNPSRGNGPVPSPLNTSRKW